ncbi:MAG: TetR/AcrR family transcriptional regulator [Deltaproteobacteria bacterium]|nr:TetR/AcrR family transcriptional regulator [Deltaproteobacteria bacterium]
MVDKEKVRGCILLSALKRFSHYGFNKTTMAEIAKDCSMSAANLYRYFKDKAEIGLCITKNHFEREHKIIIDIIERKGSPSKKLGQVFLALVNYNASEFDNSPAIMELVDHVCTNGSELIDAHREKMHFFISKILKEGQQSGDFRVSNIDETAKTIAFASIPFHATPVFLLLKCGGHTRETMQEMALRVADLMVKGIKKKKK